MKAQRVIKVCLATSGGGHLSQLLKLAESWDGYETVYITTTDVVRDKLNELGRVYIVGECNRQHPIKLFRVFCRCLKVILRERPDVFISTGAAVGCMACFLGKLQGAKIIWIDSITNVDRLSLSGRLVRHIADLFMVQWPGLVERWKKTKHLGRVI
ncbi:MAG: PssD/Cps14F family polysaccharide biosynthesis glycosyltransferase [Planctomycetota bacterium]|jgi:UDP-N-acetylglucosamine:LPS N-acetylglucosamine transferase